MLTGVLPFQAPDRLGLLRALLHDAPEPVAARAPQTPASLARIVERLLRKRPDARYASANDLLADLARAVPTIDEASGSMRRMRRRRTLTAIGVGAIPLALVAAALGLSTRGAGSGRAATVAAREPSIAVLPFADLSPDGRDAPLAEGMTQELIRVLTPADGSPAPGYDGSIPWPASRTGPVRRAPVELLAITGARA